MNSKSSRDISIISIYNIGTTGLPRIIFVFGILILTHITSKAMAEYAIIWC